MEPSSVPGWTPGQRRFFWLTFAGGFLWTLLFLLASPGWSLDDEMAHFLRSRSVWENPALIFDVWTRIGRNLFHVLPAHFGLTATRLWTLVFSALAVLLTTRLATRMGVRRTWLIPLALWFQPWFVELSWGVLTQVPFLLALLAGIWFLTTRRMIFSGLCFGALPLIRHEGMALLALWVLLAGLAELRRQPPAMLIGLLAAAALPLALYNIAARLGTGVFPFEVYLHAKPTEIYGQGPLWHFLLVGFFPAGPFTLILAVLGLAPAWKNRRACWPLIFYPAYVALHSLIFWKGLFASGGYYHFLMPIAPGLAIAAVFGADFLLERRTSWQPALARGLLAGAVLQGLVLVHVLFLQKWNGLPFQFGLPRESLHQAIQQALDWQALNRPAAPAVICRHVFAAFSRDWIETPAREKLSTLSASDLPPGSIVVWENKYSDLNRMTQADLKNPDWKEVAVFQDGQVCVFEKISR